MKNFNSRRVLFDTNILIDAVDATRPSSLAACQALKYCNGGRDLGLTTAGSLKDAYYVLKKLYGENLARDAIKRLLDLLAILPLETEACIMAASSSEPDFEDGLVRAAAELNDVAFILTRDKSAFTYSRIKSITCEEYLAIVANE